MHHRGGLRACIEGIVYVQIEEHGDYYNLYHHMDVILLEDLEPVYNLDPTYNHSSPNCHGMSCACLTERKAWSSICSQMLICISVEKEMQGGISIVSKQFTGAKNSWDQAYPSHLVLRHEQPLWLECVSISTHMWAWKRPRWRLRKTPWNKLSHYTWWRRGLYPREGGYIVEKGAISSRGTSSIQRSYTTCIMPIHWQQNASKLRASDVLLLEKAAPGEGACAEVKKLVL